MIRFSCQWRVLNVGTRVCECVVSSFLARLFCIWAWVAQGKWDGSRSCLCETAFTVYWTRPAFCLRRGLMIFSWNGYLSFVFLLTEWGNASETTQMLPSDLTIFGLQKELLKCKQEARNLQGIKVKRKQFNLLNKQILPGKAVYCWAWVEGGELGLWACICLQGSWTGRVILERALWMGSETCWGKYLFCWGLFLVVTTHGTVPSLCATWEFLYVKTITFYSFPQFYRRMSS